MKSITTLPHYQYRTFKPPYISNQDWQQLAGWTLTFIIVAIGFTYAAPMIASVLEKLYELFIQKNMLGL